MQRRQFETLPAADDKTGFGRFGRPWRPPLLIVRIAADADGSASAELGRVVPRGLRLGLARSTVRVADRSSRAGSREPRRELPGLPPHDPQAHIALVLPDENDPRARLGPGRSFLLTRPLSADRELSHWMEQSFNSTPRSPPSSKSASTVMSSPLLSEDTSSADWSSQLTVRNSNWPPEPI